jgi:nitrate reductase NapAB chaperone NapD
MRVGVLIVFAALMVKKEVLDTEDSGELIILIQAEAKEVAAYEVEALLKVHSILGSTLKEQGTESVEAFPPGSTTGDPHGALPG